MRIPITLVVFCYHERICIHAYCVNIYGGEEGAGQGGWEWEPIFPSALCSQSGRGGGSVRCWIAYLRFQSPPFARTLSPLRGPAMDVTPGCAFFIIFLHFQHADTLYIANSIGTWRCFYCQFWSRLLYAGDTDLFGCSALRSSNSVSLFHQLVLLYKWFEWVFRVKWFIVSNVFHWIWMSGSFHASNLKDL